MEKISLFVSENNLKELMYLLKDNENWNCKDSEIEEFVEYVIENGFDLNYNTLSEFQEELEYKNSDLI